MTPRSRCSIQIMGLQAILGVNTQGAVDQAGMRCQVVSKGQMVTGLQAVGEGAVRKADEGIAPVGTK